MIFLVTLLAVVLLGVDIGLFVGIGFAFLTVVLRTQLSQFAIYGNVSGTEIYKNMAVYPIVSIKLVGMRVYFDLEVL